MSYYFKKILSFTLFMLILGTNLIIVHHASAESTSIDLGDSGDSFNVQSILNVQTTDDGSQGHTYFDSENDATPPAVAFILDVVNFITKMVGAVAVLLIIIGGLMMIVSQGEEHLLQKGKDVLIAAIFGVAIVMLSYIIVRFVQSLFYLPNPS